METRRLLLAILLSLIVLVGWQYLLGPPPTPPGDETPQPIGEELRPETRAPEVLEAEEPSERHQAGEEGLAEAPAPEARISASEEQRLSLETDRVQAVFTNRGAQLVSFQLKKHENEQGLPLDLVRAREHGPYPFGLTAGTPEQGWRPHPLNEALFQAEEIRSEDGDPGLRFRYAGPEGDATKVFTFKSDPRGTIDDLIALEIRLPGQSNWGMILGPGVRNVTLEEREKHKFDRHAAVYDHGGDLERLDAAKTAEPVLVPGGGLSWVGLEDTYFLTVLRFDPPSRGVRQVLAEPQFLIPGEDGFTARFEPVPPKDRITREQKDLAREILLVIEPEAEALIASSFWGSKQLELLAALDLDQTIDLGGPLRVLADPLLRGLHWLYRHVVSNYGWAIVLMTLALKLVLLPLTHKSYVSMRKMQELNPKIQALRAKYKGKLKDKQGRPNLEAQRKQNEEMMALYKSEGVNPASGCLPMLVQMPVLFAFYYILRAAVELRHAPWIFWVHDLSAADPFYVLPVVMAGTQFLQQRMTPMAGDPMQRRLFQLMPLFFLVIFLGMPAGLVLYWLTNNVLTIAQQSIYNHLKQRASSSSPTSEKPVGGKRSRSSAAK